MNAHECSVLARFDEHFLNVPGNPEGKKNKQSDVQGAVQSIEWQNLDQNTRSATKMQGKKQPSSNSKPWKPEFLWSDPRKWRFFLSKGLLLGVIQAGVGITWNNSVFILLSMVQKVFNRTHQKTIIKQSYSPKGFQKGILLIISICSFVEFMIFQPNLWFRYTPKPHWDFTKEAFLSGSARTADTVHVVLSSGEEVTTDLKLPKSSRVIRQFFACASFCLGDFFFAAHDKFAPKKHVWRIF